jgi:hypothetical protein
LRSRLDAPHLSHLDERGLVVAALDLQVQATGALDSDGLSVAR